MNGIFLIHKPTGITSRDVVDAIGRKFNTKKVGHTGTLDPFADGLMMITMEKATKAGTFIENLDKRYEATIVLGQQTDTGDLTGKVINTSEMIDLYDQFVVDTLESFLGPQTQIPPMYSAIKKDGVPLYELAREGKTIPREPRAIIIYEIGLLALTKTTIRFHVRCSKGTYIRTLAEDICAKLGMVGHLSQLTRIAIGQYKLAAAKTLDQVVLADVLTVEQALSFMHQIIVDQPVQVKAIQDGKIQRVVNAPDKVLFVDKQKQVLAVYQRQQHDQYVCLRGLF
jgi:tRNA pseudouridine55 synthase